MPNGYATANLLHAVNLAARNVTLPDEDNSVDDEAPRTFGEPPSPHDQPGRKWFNRGLISVCLFGFIVLAIPDSLRHRLNGWESERIAAARYAASYQAPITCATVKVTGLNLKCRKQQITYCQQTVDGVIKYASERC